MGQLTTKNFSFYTKKSFGFHFAFVALVLATSYFQWAKGEQQRKLNVKLVQSSVRVDVVAMPQKTFQELKALQESGQTAEAVKVEAEPAKNAVPDTPDTGNEFLEAKKKVNFADMLKQYSKKDVEKAKKPKNTGKKAKDGLDKKALANLSGLIKRGNKVQSGQALVGSGSAENLTILQEYATKLPGMVKPFWKLPSYLMEKELQCRVKVFINNRGEVVRAEIYEKSDDPEYDERALKAVKTASPFPAPPGEIVARTLRGDILLGFPL